jgi:hypothetical protein
MAETCDNLNRRLEGTGLALEVGYRYGYVALDWRNAKGMHSTELSGATMREAHTYVYAMIRALDARSGSLNPR